MRSMGRVMTRQGSRSLPANPATLPSPWVREPYGLEALSSIFLLTLFNPLPCLQKPQGLGSSDFLELNLFRSEANETFVCSPGEATDCGKGAIQKGSSGGPRGAKGGPAAAAGAS